MIIINSLEIALCIIQQLVASYSSNTTLYSISHIHYVLNIFTILDNAYPLLDQCKLFNTREYRELLSCWNIFQDSKYFSENNITNSRSKIRGNMNTQGTYNNGKLLIVQPSAAKPITTSTTNFCTLCFYKSITDLSIKYFLCLMY